MPFQMTHVRCMKVKSEREVTQSCPTPRDPMDCSPPGSSVHGILQARVLEWDPIALLPRPCLSVTTSGKSLTSSIPSFSPRGRRGGRRGPVGEPSVPTQRQGRVLSGTAPRQPALSSLAEPTARQRVGLSHLEEPGCPGAAPSSAPPAPLFRGSHTHGQWVASWPAPAQGKVLSSHGYSPKEEAQALPPDLSLSFSRSGVSDSVTPWTAARQASLSITNSRSLLKLMPIESVMPSNHLILCRPLPLLPSIFPSIRVFSNESALRIRWPKYWSISFSISPSNEYSGLIFLGPLQPLFKGQFYYLTQILPC